MFETPLVNLVGREEQLARVRVLQREMERGGAGCLWVTGGDGSGKSAFLDVCAARANGDGWQVLQGQCTQETRTDPYGPFLSMLGLAFDRSGRLINDRSVYSIVDQISLDDVFDAVSDIPGMSVVAFGIKVGMSIFESRRNPHTDDDLLNRNFEFILQVLEQIGKKRQKPLLLTLDDLDLASATTYALVDYVLTRIQGVSLLIVATWRASSIDEGLQAVRERLPRWAALEHLVHLPPLPEAHMRQVLEGTPGQEVQEPLASTLIELSQGIPGRLVESLRLVGLVGKGSMGGGLMDEGSAQAAPSVDSDSFLAKIVDRHLAQLPAREQALLQCAAVIGQRVPLDVLTAGPLCAYLGVGERDQLVSIGDIADQGTLLEWDGDQHVRFTLSSVRQVLLGRVHAAVQRRDHLRIAESWLAVDGEPNPAQLAEHYLAGRDLDRAIDAALQSGEGLLRLAAYPEAVQSYQVALQALRQLPDSDPDREYEILSAVSLAAEQAGDWEQAASYLDEALQHTGDDSARKAELYAGLGWLQFQRGEIQSALESLNHSQKLYASLEDVQGQSQVDYYSGVIYGHLKEWQRAAACFERYLEVCETLSLEEGCASALIELGNLYRLQRDWPRAVEYLEQGIERAQANGDFFVLARGYNYLGSCYALQGHPGAIDTLQRALEIVSKRTKQPAEEARIQNTLAETLVRVNRWAEAEEAFQASATIKERLGDRAGLAMTYGGLGRMYLRQWRFDQAIDYLQRDIDLLSAEKEANAAWIQQWTNLIGEARRLQGKHELAAGRFKEALRLTDLIPDERVREQSLAFTRMLVARMDVDRGDLRSAAANCALAWEVLSETWAKGEVERTAAMVARAQGDLDRAATHLDQAGAVAERGEDLDRGVTYLERMYLCLDRRDRDQAQVWAGRIIEIARRLQNEELAQRASLGLGA